jgi:hypothetical protein
MRFKSFPVLVLILTISTLGKAQLPVKKFKWKHLGPFEMAPSNVDTGKWTAVGQGWIEDVLITDKSGLQEVLQVVYTRVRMKDENGRKLIPTVSKWEHYVYSK